MYRIIITDRTDSIHGLLFGITAGDWFKYVLPVASWDKDRTVYVGEQLCAIHNRIAGLLLCYAYNDDFLKDDERQELIARYTDKLKLYGNGTADCTQKTLADCVGDIKRRDFAEAESNIEFLVDVFSERKARIKKLNDTLNGIERFISRYPEIPKVKDLLVNIYNERG